MKIRLFLLMGVLAAAVVPTQAAGRVECNQVESARMRGAVKYCVLLPPSYDTDKARRFAVLYYLHGLGDDEQSLVSTGGWNLIERLWEDKSIGEFLIAVPDGGLSFYINSRDGRAPYEDFFIREFIPLMDKNYRTIARGSSRALLGISMGGYGALRFAFKYTGLFTAVATHSAALAQRVPGELAAAASPGSRLGVFGRVFGTPVDRAFFERNSPFTLVRRSVGLERMKIYFDCGRQDEFGFDAGNNDLSELLTQRGVAHEFHLYSGGHGWGYVADHLHESLQFVSRALRLTQ